jgi:hypothetical protein
VRQPGQTTAPARPFRAGRLPVARAHHNSHAAQELPAAGPGRSCPRIIRRLAKTFFALVTLWGLSLVVLALEAPRLPGNVQLPLGSLSGLAIGPEGQIYIGCGTYGRANIYDRNGKFLRAVAAPGRPFRLVATTEGNLLVGYWGLSRTMSVFRTDGRFLYKRIMTLEELQGLFGNAQQRRVRAAGGAIYKIQGHWGLGSAVVRLTDGHREVIISQSWRSWLCQSPFPALWYLSAGVAGLLLALRRRAPSSLRESARPELRSQTPGQQRPPTRGWRTRPA